MSHQQSRVDVWQAYLLNATHLQLRIRICSIDTLQLSALKMSAGSMKCKNILNHNFYMTYFEIAHLKNSYRNFC